jgi:hypothetical protein
MKKFLAVMVAVLMLASVAMAGGHNVAYFDFGPGGAGYGGIWQYKQGVPESLHSSGWLQISQDDPQCMKVFGRGLLAGFPESGIWLYDGECNDVMCINDWKQISTTTSPCENIEVK